MTKYAIGSKTLADIASAIRGDVLEETDKFTPAQMPEKIQQVVGIHRDSAYQMGASENYDTAFKEGQEQGEKDSYNEFWNAYQDDGNRTHYYNGFSGYGWNENNFKPKHDIKPVGSSYGIFMYSRINGDLVEIAEKQGIEIDFSSATNLQYGFATTLFTHIGIVDASNCTTLLRAFEGNTYLEKIDKIILNNTGTTNLSDAFNSDKALEEIRFEGVIGTNGVSFGTSKLLSHESLMSIIAALKDRSGEGTAYTCTLGEENLAKLSADEIKTATDKGWTLV